MLSVVLSVVLSVEPGNILHDRAFIPADRAVRQWIAAWMPYFDVRTHALIGPFPVLIVGGLLAFSAALTWAALAWTVRRDF